MRELFLVAQTFDLSVELVSFSACSAMVGFVLGLFWRHAAYNRGRLGYATLLRQSLSMEREFDRDLQEQRDLSDARTKAMGEELAGLQAWIADLFDDPALYESTLAELRDAGLAPSLAPVTDFVRHSDN